MTSGSLKGMWEATQGLLAAGHLSAGHDVSDGGIATTLLEMACGSMARSTAAITAHVYSTTMVCIYQYQGAVASAHCPAHAPGTQPQRRLSGTLLPPRTRSLARAPLCWAHTGIKLAPCIHSRP